MIVVAVSTIPLALTASLAQIGIVEIAATWFLTGQRTGSGRGERKGFPIIIAYGSIAMVPFFQRIGLSKARFVRLSLELNETYANGRVRQQLWARSFGSVFGSTTPLFGLTLETESWP